MCPKSLITPLKWHSFLAHKVSWVQFCEFLNMFEELLGFTNFCLFCLVISTLQKFTLQMSFKRLASTICFIETSKRAFSHSHPGIQTLGNIAWTQQIVHCPLDYDCGCDVFWPSRIWSRRKHTVACKNHLCLWWIHHKRVLNVDDDILNKACKSDMCLGLEIVWQW